MFERENLVARCHACVRELNQQQGWGLSGAQIAAYAEQIVQLVPAQPLEQGMAQVIGYFHSDHQRVADLRAPGNLGHTAAWAWVMAEVARTAQSRYLSWSRDPMVDRNDLLQIVHTEVVRSLPDYRFASRLSTWIHSVTVRRLRRFHRDAAAAKRAVWPEPLEAAFEYALEEEPSEQRLLASTLVAEVKRVLDATGDERYAHIFLLRVVGEYSNEEIAARIKLHPSRVRALLKIARELLRADPSLRGWAQAGPPDEDGAQEGSRSPYNGL